MEENRYYDIEDERLKKIEIFSKIRNLRKNAHQQQVQPLKRGSGDQGGITDDPPGTSSVCIPGRGIVHVLQVKHKHGYLPGVYCR